MKRIYAAVAIILIMLTSLSACSNSADNEGSGNPSPEITAELTPDISSTQEGITAASETDALKPDITEPMPSPTPHIDISEAASLTKTYERSSEDLAPVIIENSDIEGVLNPFYATAEGDLEIVEKTQLKLLAGETPFGGNDYPCLAYAVKKLSDREYGFDFERPENMSVYRITLKTGIKFQDGTPVTIDDVMFNLKLLASKDYEGPFAINDIGIYGMEEYYTQIPPELKDTADAAIKVGIKKDGTFKKNEELISQENQEKFWGCADAAGTAFAADIIEYVNTRYNKDAYVNAFLSTGLTYKTVSKDENLRTAYAMAFFGYVHDYNYKTKILKDNFDAKHDLNTETLDALAFWKLILKYYGYNFDFEDGINHEVVSADKSFEDYLREAFYAEYGRVEEIAGIKTGTVVDSAGVERQYLEVLLNDNEDISRLNFFVAEKSFYENNLQSINLHGAGEYILKTFDLTTAELTANDDYILGMPKQKYLTYVKVQEETQE